MLQVLIWVLLAWACASQAQDAAQPRARPQSNTFNSLFTLTNEDLRLYDLTTTQARTINVAVRFERSNWASSGSVHADPFYRAPANSSNATPGQVLEVEHHTNTSYYSLPPSVALSRLMFQSEDVNGSAVPASAFVLWPFIARSFPNEDDMPIVAWAHGTSGQFAENAPSHIRNLWYQYSAPFELALQGYVVVAPDYAGQGVDRDAAGKFVPHQYGMNPAGANDVFHAVAAAQKAWPSLLGSRFVVMSHSQGGGVAWSAAVRQAQNPVEGYMGAIAGSPSTSILNIVAGKSALKDVLSVAISFGVESIFPTFELEDWLTPAGASRARLLRQIQGGQSAIGEIVSLGGENAHPNWTETWYAKAFEKLTSVVGKRVAGPMLVLQGTADPQVNVSATNTAVDELCMAHPDSKLSYAQFSDVSHVPVLYAGRRIWEDWLLDRFNGIDVPEKCQRRTYSPAIDSSAYQSELGYYLQYPTAAYETA